jgi:hypothetical protein
MLTRMPSYEVMDELIPMPKKPKLDSDTSVPLDEETPSRPKFRANELIRLEYHQPTVTPTVDGQNQGLYTLSRLHADKMYDRNPTFTHQLFEDEIIDFITSYVAPDPLTIHINLNNLAYAVVYPSNITADEQETFLKCLSKPLPADHMIASSDQDASSMLTTSKPSITIPGHVIHNFQRYLLCSDVSIRV